jgi:hypothetical protein
MPFWITLIITVLLISTAQAQTPNHLWVIRQPDQIAEYDPASFEILRTLKVPPRVVEHPGYLLINSKGQILFYPPYDVEWAAGEMAKAGRRVWFWDGRQAREWDLEANWRNNRKPGKTSLTETRVQDLLSADGEHLFRFENTFEILTDGTGAEISLRAGSRLWRTDLSGSGAESIAAVSIPGRCRCETGVCSETCPEFSFWAPDGTVRDFFLMTRFIPGQIGATYQETVLYRRSGRNWTEKKLGQPVEKPLDGSENGEILAVAVPDGGCCAWANESSDQLLLFAQGRISVLFDEFSRYGNSDYDVSFYPANARLSPGKEMIAYTIETTAMSPGDIRLSSGGKDNLEALARVRKGIGETPAVEIISLEGKSPRTTILRASLAGWLTGREILLVREGTLSVYDTAGRQVRKTAVRVRNAADVFLR